VVAVSREITKILKDLQRSTPDIEASALVSTDGTIIASELPPEIEEANLRAATTAMVFLGEKSTKNLAGGDLKQLYVTGDNGHILLRPVGKKAILIGKVRENAQMRSVFVNLRKTEGKLAEITDKKEFFIDNALLDNFSHDNSKKTALEREALLKKYKIKIPSEETILEILHKSGISWKKVKSTR
jgi:hypothetical protein